MIPDNPQDWSRENWRACAMYHSDRADRAMQMFRRQKILKRKAYAALLLGLPIAYTVGAYVEACLHG